MSYNWQQWETRWNAIKLYKCCLRAFIKLFSGFLEIKLTIYFTMMTLFWQETIALFMWHAHIKWRCHCYLFPLKLSQLGRTAFRQSRWPKEREIYRSKWLFSYILSWLRCWWKAVLCLPYLDPGQLTLLTTFLYFPRDGSLLLLRCGIVVGFIFSLMFKRQLPS